MSWVACLLDGLAAFLGGCGGWILFSLFLSFFLSFFPSCPWRLPNQTAPSGKDEGCVGCWGSRRRSYTATAAAGASQSAKRDKGSVCTIEF